MHALHLVSSLVNFLNLIGYGVELLLVEGAADHEGPVFINRVEDMSGLT